jgi:hypothetical protein
LAEPAATSTLAYEAGTMSGDEDDPGRTHEGYGPEALEILRGLDSPPKRSSVNIGSDESDDLPTPPLFGEDYYEATILDIVCRHCKAEDGLDSRGDRLRAELMMLCEEAGDIEIKDQFGWLITANLTPEGLNTLAALAEQEAREQAKTVNIGSDDAPPNGNDP